MIDEALRYSPLDLARIFGSMEDNLNFEIDDIEWFFNNQNRYLEKRYRKDFKSLCQKYLYFSHYINEKRTLDKVTDELSYYAELEGKEFSYDEYTAEIRQESFYFKKIRIELICAGEDGKDYKRIKLRSLLKYYGRKKKTNVILSLFDECLRFYKLNAFRKGNEPISLSEAGLDEMITFRLK